MPKPLLFLTWILLLFASGCVHDDLVDCGDGTACPTGTACHATGCLARTQLAACDGAADLAACSTEAIPIGVCSAGACLVAGCGNAVLEPGEQCDDGNRTDRDGCAGNCLSDETCGNGFIDTLMGEACDDGNLTSGDGCQMNCTLPVCGDGVVDVGRNEECDAGTDNSDSAPDRCRTNCKQPRCGDGVEDTGEQCDDGNADNGDGCRNDCVLPSCGNGTLDPGEECDDGNLTSNDGCQHDCRLPRCGDGIRDDALNETCDLGALNSDQPDALCRVNCRQAGCGDGVLDPAFGEQCDDANKLLGDGCRPDCTAEVCGDGILDSRLDEECDDGNTNDLDDCRTTCLRARCGDGILDPDLFEECDLGDANAMTPNALCRPNCRLATCGDGIIDTVAGEQCDDTNHLAGDACSPSCKLEVCGNGIVDPGEQCDDGNASNTDACHTNCRVPRCGDGFHDVLFNEECDAGEANANTGGAACRTNCRLPICGDGILDPGEVCDDGNFAVGDGCAPDCMSDETCGNDRLDLASGEECDDGALRSHDGCSSRCLLEFPRWDDVTPSLLTARSRHAAVHDGARRRLVVFGGAPPPNMTGPTPLLGDTWEYDGAAWIQRHPTVAPSARMDHTLVYDSHAGLVYLFGGLTATGQRLNDLWRWDGVNWAQVTATGTAPAARSDAAVVYDPRARAIVVFGGRTATGYLADTWEFRDGAWTLRSFAGTVPSARSSVAVAYHPVLGGMVIAGGELSASSLSRETWVFRGQSWSQLADGPEQRGAAMTWSPHQRAMLLLGGESTGGLEPTTWRFTDAWSELPTNGGPSARAHHTFTALVHTEIVVATGGTTADEITAEAWTLDREEWAPTTALPGPSARIGAGVAYDPLRGVVVMHGGIDAGHVFDETWEWTGLAWIQREPSTVPAGSYRPTMVFDPTSRQMLLHGGSAQASCTTGVQSTTWTWDGDDWHFADQSSGGAVCLAGATYDARADKVVMIGGSLGPTSRQTALVWTGGGWAANPERDAVRPLSGRTLAYDGPRDETWHFGNPEEAASTKLEPAWFGWRELWSAYDGEFRPPPRRRNATVFDPNRGGITVFGGNGLAGPLDDVWFLRDGRKWSQVAASMPINFDPETPAVVYHAASASFVAVAAPLNSGGTTFTMRYESRTPDEACWLHIDRDGDGLRGLEDPDCWPYKNANCAPCTDPGGCSCAHESCGDGVCSPLEDWRTCGDCTATDPVCGDHHCDSGEDCPGDCS